MTTNEMAQKGFNTGFTDADGNELHVGDYVRLCGDIGEIVFSCGAFGIFIVDEVPWDALEELVRKDSGNRPSFLYNDNFISFWEIVWNLSEDSDEPCLPHVKSVTALEEFRDLWKCYDKDAAEKAQALLDCIASLFNKDGESQ